MDVDQIYLQENNDSEFTEEMMEIEDDKDDDNEEDIVEHERCGICTDVVIDRGVLDGCDHWFCFACIDNWATITNRCPLCENEFQLIKCLPVYDTTGSINLENYSILRDDDDWSIQENNNTLTFPSYYIDEGAVVCLDGDGCKVRGGLSNEDSLIYDTSIACDSCDIWYHAFCVGFDTDCASDSSWLCPRCVTVEEQQTWGGNSTNKNDSSFFSIGTEQGLATDPFLGRVSVSVADDGETALVVSMIQGEMVNEDNNSVMSKNGTETGSREDNKSSLSNNTVNLPKVNQQVEIYDNIESKFSGLVADSTNISSSSKFPNSSVSFIDGSFETDFLHQNNELVIHASAPALVEETTSNTVAYSPINDTSSVTLDRTRDAPISTLSLVVPVSEMDGTNICNISKNNDDLCKESGTYQNIDLLSQNNWETEAQHEVSVASLSDVATSRSGKHVGSASTNKEIVDALGNGNVEGLVLHSRHADRGNNQKRRKEVSEENLLNNTAKKVKLERKHLVVQSGNQVDDTESFRSYSKASAKSETLDIMTIVRGTDRKPRVVQTEERPVNKIAENGKGSAGLRVRKIMRRVGDKKETSLLLQSLGKEIKEVIQGKSNSSTEKDKASDIKLLTAFREAMLKTRVEADTKLDHSLLKARKKMLQKSKVRDNLTKKIYATSNGKRRRAWDRDREIEFWKYRCSDTKLEKIDTLQSVLECLRKATSPSAQSHEEDQGPNGEASDSILSRVYLADSSVFPRNDSIKPLSAMPVGSGIQTVPKRNPSNQQSATEGNGFSTSIFPTKDATKFGNAKPQKKEPAKQPIEIKSDKKKWALEVLARKNALATSSVSKDTEEDGDIIKGSYPLLAQLPKDMRPMAAPSHHNKVPASIRKAQLFRITEHYLKRTNLAAMVRTADTELAVADAVNVEKEICEKSNSKMVYMNLCAQFLSHHAKLNTAIASRNHDQETSSSNQDIGTTAEQLHDIDAEEALRLAGLSSDSPPNSPEEHMDINADSCSLENNKPATDGDVPNIDKNIGSNSENVCAFPFEIRDNALNPSHLESENALESMKLDENCNKCSLRPESSEKTGVAINEDKFLVSTSSNCLSLHKHQTGCETGNDTSFNVDAEATLQISQRDTLSELTLGTSELLSGLKKETPLKDMSVGTSGYAGGVLEVESSAFSKVTENNETSEFQDVYQESGCTQSSVEPLKCKSSAKEGSTTHSVIHTSKEEMSNVENSQHPDFADSIFRKVEAYVKEHIRPLCKIGVITVEQYRWAVKRTTDKVMGYHHKAKNASFLIKEGEKVKRLADQYVEISQKKDLGLQPAENQDHK